MARQGSIRKKDAFFQPAVITRGNQHKDTGLSALKYFPLHLTSLMLPLLPLRPGPDIETPNSAASFRTLPSRKTMMKRSWARPCRG